MARKMRQPKKPRLTASKNSWDKYEKRMKEYVDAQNERTRRNGLKEKLLSKIK